jgi:flagellar basal-body rod modification protein FlgD
MTTAGIQSTTPGNQLPGGKTSKGMQLNANDFIKMMITQLQNQDPTEPAKSDQLLAQMSQIGQLQSSTQLQSSLSGLVQQNQIASAGNLIGKSVEGMDDANNTVHGTVDSVNVQATQVVLHLHTGADLQMSRVTKITNGATPTTPAA